MLLASSQSANPEKQQTVTLWLTKTTTQGLFVGNIKESILLFLGMFGMNLFMMLINYCQTDMCLTYDHLHVYKNTEQNNSLLPLHMVIFCD